MRAMLSLTLTLATALPAAAGEQKVPLEKLPKAVKAAFAKHFPGATADKASSEKENGKTVYEIAFTFKGAKTDATFEGDGTLVDVEKEVAAKDLPRRVAAALEAKYPKATYKKAEEISKGDGKPTAYEVLLVTAGGTKLEVKLDPSGKITGEESKGK
jgi:uncharacterized membrane protein YkoI